MAVAVIGGLISSTVLSLVLVPVVYSLIDQFERWLGPWAAKLATNRTPEDEVLLRGKRAHEPESPGTPAE
jgi:HAE1 family hydrophobic/amphiphilic exporter-1